MNIESFIDTLNTEQQQAALDLLWQRLSADGQSLPSPAWHGEVLEYRDANPSGKPKLPVPDAKIEVKRMVEVVPPILMLCCGVGESGQTWSRDHLHQWHKAIGVDLGQSN